MAKPRRRIILLCSVSNQAGGRGRFLRSGRRFSPLFGMYPRFFLSLLVCLLGPSGLAYGQRITQEKIVDRSYTFPYVGALCTPTGLLLLDHAVHRPVPTSSAHYFQLVSRHLDSLDVSATIDNSVWQSQATVRSPSGGYAVATTVVGQNWPTEQGDLAFYRYSSPLAFPRITRIKDLDGGSSDYSTDILPAADGYFISAFVTGRSARQQFKLLKMDTTGNIVWQKNYGLNINDVITGMRYTATGNILLSGQSGVAPSNDTRLRMLLVNPAGDSLANLIYQAPNLGPNANVLANGAFEDRLLALRGGGFAQLAELDTTGTTYSLVLKVNRRLQPQWQFTYRPAPLFGLARRMFFAGACELRDSSILVLASNQFGSPQNNPFYLLRLDGATGQLRNSYQLLSNICAQFRATKLLPDGDSAVFVLGTCAGGGTQGTYAAHVSLRGLPAVVLGTASPAPPAVAGPQFEALYPNPANEIATLSYRSPAGAAGPGAVRVRDMLGREVRQLALPAGAAGHVALPVATLPGGLYFCELSWPNHLPLIRKLLVQH